MGFFTTPDYDEFCILLEKATSEFIPGAQEDLALNLELTDLIKSKRIGPKDAIKLIRTRLLNPNPNVQLLTIQLLDKCVKNGGKHFLVEMAGREFVDAIVSLLDTEEFGTDCNPVVQERLAELFQEWALLFQSDPQLSYFTDTYQRLKREMPILFPRPSSSLNQLDPTTIVSTTAAPDWIDSSVCLRCRDPFTFSNRKHHCRKCGGCFCDPCSSNQMSILAMGINEHVRVCDPCFEAAERGKKVRVEEIPAPEPVKPAEDEDLKRAIEASLQDQLKLALQPTEPIPPVMPVVQSFQPVPPVPQIQPISTVPQVQSISAVPESTQTAQPIQTFQSQPITQLPQSHPEPNARDLVLAIELETAQLFNQLVTRLTTTTTQSNKTTSDHPALLHLSNEMRSLQRRLQQLPQHATLCTELTISLGRLELLLAPQARPQSSSASSNGSSELERMRGSFLGGLRSPNEPLRHQLRSLSIEGTAYAAINEDLLKRPSQPDQFFASGLPVTPLGPIETDAPIIIPARTVINENFEVEKKSKKRKKEKERKKRKEEKEKEKEKKKKTKEEKEKQTKEVKEKQKEKKKKTKEGTEDKEKKHQVDDEGKPEKAKEDKKASPKKAKSKTPSDDEKMPIEAKRQSKRLSSNPEKPEKREKQSKDSSDESTSAKRRRSERNQKETINLIDL